MAFSLSRSTYKRRKRERGENTRRKDRREGNCISTCKNIVFHGDG